MSTVISSFANPTVKWVKSLARRKVRRKEQLFVVEGLQPVWRAATSSWRIHTLVISPELLTNDHAWDTINRQEQLGAHRVDVTAAVFAHLSDRDGPTGLLAVVHGSIGSVDELAPAQARPVVALWEPGNPGNIGAIVRVADAAGVGGVILLGSSADPLAPTAVKASMGSLFAVPVAHTASFDELREWAVTHNRPILAMTGSGSGDLWSDALPPHGIYLFGSEGAGLPANIAEQCAAQVALAMEGTAESLNLATATAISMYELARRRSECNSA